MTADPEFFQRKKGMGDGVSKRLGSGAVLRSPLGPGQRDQWGFWYAPETTEL